MNAGSKRRTHAPFWAAIPIALIAMVAAAASAYAGGSGGISTPSDQGTERTSSAHSGRCAAANFGKRALQLGDCGTDVKTLHWILKANEEGSNVKARPTFVRSTDKAVRKVQRRSGLRRSGVVNDKTRRALIKRMRRSIATWYGPGFWGNRTACGQRLRKGTVGVAHKKLPCGTKVTIAHRGHFVRTKVIDRGPYAHGASWDLTQAAARKVKMKSTTKVRAAVIR